MTSNELMAKMMAIFDPVINQRDEAQRNLLAAKLDLAAVRAELVAADARVAELEAQLTSLLESPIAQVQGHGFESDPTHCDESVARRLR